MTAACNNNARVGGYAPCEELDNLPALSSMGEMAIPWSRTWL